MLVPSLIALILASVIHAQAPPTCAPTPPPINKGSSNGCGVRGVLCAAYGCCDVGLVCGTGGYCQIVGEPTLTGSPVAGGPPTDTQSPTQPVSLVTASPTCAPTPPPIFSGSTNGCGVRGVLCTAYGCCDVGLVCGAGGYCQAAGEPTLTGPPVTATVPTPDLSLTSTTDVPTNTGVRVVRPTSLLFAMILFCAIALVFSS